MTTLGGQNSPGRRAGVSDVRHLHDPGKLDGVVARIGVGNADHVDRAVRAAHVAYPAWRDTAPAQRVDPLMAASQMLPSSADEFASLLAVPGAVRGTGRARRARALVGAAGGGDAAPTAHVDVIALDRLATAVQRAERREVLLSRPGTRPRSGR